MRLLLSPGALALLLGALALLPAPRAASAAVVLPDTTRPGVHFLPRFQPTALYSASRGFGIAGGVGIRNAGWAGSEVEVGARLSQRFQSASVYLYTQDPYVAPLYGLVGGRVRTSTRQRFYGLGPFSDHDDRLDLDFTSAQVEARLGWYPFGHSGLLLQPGVRLVTDHLSDFEDADSVEATFPDAASIANLASVVGQTRYGVSLGLEVSHDTRDALVMTRQGVLAEASVRRLFALDAFDPDLRFNRAQVRVFGFHPLLGRRVILFGRAVAAMTRADDDPTGTRLPFYYLPALDDALLPGYAGERFFDRDLFAAGAGVRFPLIDLFGVLGLDGVLTADVGSSYHDITEEFSLAVAFDEPVVDDGGGVPLRPSVGLGFNLVNVDQDRRMAGILFGFSPEGFTLTGLQIVYDFRDLLPLFR